MTEEQHKLIEKNKIIIEAFQKSGDLYFDTLCVELNLTEEGINLMFDYIFNENEKISFDEYLSKYGDKTLKDFIESDSGDDIEYKEDQ